MSWRRDGRGRWGTEEASVPATTRLLDEPYSLYRIQIRHGELN
jgi:hypothetical protein